MKLCAVFALCPCLLSAAEERIDLKHDGKPVRECSCYRRTYSLAKHWSTQGVP